MIRTCLVLGIGLAGLVLAGLALGDQAVSGRELLAILTGSGPVDPQLTLIVLDLRLPRIMLAMLVGGALGAAGTLAQVVMRNPLAEPGILGINAGAALAAMFVIVVLDDAPVELLPWAGFAGASLMAACIYALSWHNGTSSLRIILVGIGLGSLANGATLFLTAVGDIGDVQRAMIWLAGSVYHADWRGVRSLLLWLLAPLLLSLVFARELDLMRFGDQTARSLGQRVDRVRAIAIILCTLLSGAAVAAAGSIGFVGLIAPHMARRLVGSAHGRVVPVSVMIGAGLVVAADIAGRTIIAPAQVPAGLMTAIVGAPFFAYLLWERRNVPT